MLNKKINLLLIIALLSSIVTSASAYDNENSKVENFVLKDYNNNLISKSDFNNSNAVVVMFISTKCPVSNAYNSRIVDLHKTYVEKNITFLGINSNKQEGIEEIKQHARENLFEFPVLKDNNNLVADIFGASVTPEVYVLNSKNEVLYHGRIDDSRREGEVTSTDLKNALDNILNGERVSYSKTKAFGCSIKRVTK